MGKRKENDSEDVHHQVNLLRKKHQQAALLSGDDPSHTLFWTKKVERDVKQGSGQPSLEPQHIARERERELERVRARR
jgi:hypothetical protein